MENLDISRNKKLENKVALYKLIVWTINICLTKIAIRTKELFW